MTALIPQKLVRMASLARLSGVPAPTIKHYLREELLPREYVRATRNAALYDVVLVERIQRIKALQRERFLPLRVIKSVLMGHPSAEDDAAATQAVQDALDAMASKESRTREQLLGSGMRPEDLALCETMGIVSPIVVNGHEAFCGDDLNLLRLLGTSRRRGITKEMLPVEIVGSYVLAIRELVRVELELFRQGVMPRAGKDLSNITEAATQLSEQLVVLVRRKLLMPTLRAMVEERMAAREAAPKEQRRAKKRHAAKATVATTASAHDRRRQRGVT